MTTHEKPYVGQLFTETSPDSNPTFFIAEEVHETHAILRPVNGGQKYLHIYENSPQRYTFQPATSITLLMQEGHHEREGQRLKDLSDDQFAKANLFREAREKLDEADR